MIIRSSYIILFLFLWSSNTVKAHDPADSTQIKTNTNPTIVYTSSPLSVVRDNDTLSLHQGDHLHKHDTIETGPKGFAILRYPGLGDVFVLPMSDFHVDGINENKALISLKSADIYLETYKSDSAISVRCFDKNVIGNQFATSIQCRGQAGIVVAVLSGTATLQTGQHAYDLKRNEAMIGRVSSPVFSSIDIPVRPSLTLVGQPDTTSGGLVFQWEPVPMADQYLVHIFNNEENHEFHLLTLHHNHRFIVNDLPVSMEMYQIRVMPIDYYGVSGHWSNIISFEFLDYES